MFVKSWSNGHARLRRDIPRTREGLSVQAGCALTTEIIRFAAMGDNCSN
jgi:hypothetical protein